MTKSNSKVRVDKWLWSVRIYKSRSIATAACKSGKVRISGEPAKASSTVCIGDLVDIRKEGFNLTFEVTDLIEKRVSAPLAQACYKNLTTEEELNKYKDWFIGKAPAEIRAKGTGRPTKRERREIDLFKESWDFELD